MLPVILISSDTNTVLQLQLKFKAFIVTGWNEVFFAEQRDQYRILFHTDMANHARTNFYCKTNDGHKVYLWVVSELG
jgi:hypothetical protein